MKLLFSILVLVLSTAVLLTACGDGGGGGGVAPSPVRYVYVANSSVPSISVYDASQTDDIEPLKYLGSVTKLARPVGIAVDTVNNEIFVANNGNNSITVFGRTANGNATPIRTISGTSTGLSDPAGIAVDTMHDEIFVANYYSGNSSITVYGRTANGNATTPIRTISGIPAA